MSTLANWSYKEGSATIWPVLGTDVQNQPLYGEPYVIEAIDFSWGGKRFVRADGTQFTPKITIYFEMAYDDEKAPERGWYAALGVIDAPEPPREAKPIIEIESWPANKFDAGLPDWRIML